MLAQKPWIVPLPGTTVRSHLADDIEAADIVLTPEELDEIEEALSRIEIRGARYPDDLDERTYR